MTTSIDLIRHGEPLGGRRYRGYGVDDALSEKGWQQMWDAIGDTCPWDIIVSSPLQRCYEFAQALAEKKKRPMKIMTDLKEVGFGTWEGRSKDEIKQANRAEFDAFYADPVHARPQGAENLQCFSDRVNQVYAQVCAEYVAQHVLIVAHAGVIRAIVAQQLGAPIAAVYQLQIDNAGLTRLENFNSKNTLVFLNRKGYSKKAPKLLDI